VTYVPDRLCVELKSLKLYLWSFRDEGHYFEQATNQILDDLVRSMRPRRITVVGRFNVRGGIGTTVVAHAEGDARRGSSRAPAGPADSSAAGGGASRSGARVRRPSTRAGRADRA
jgi:7-cyano-7-deazaguanine reductase